MQSIFIYLAKWNKTSDSLAKLQGVYGALAIALLFIAGLVSLVHYNFGQSILFLAAVAALTFVGNGVVWSLLRTFVVPYIEKHTAPKTRKK